jgi:hypothetical protein
MDAVRYKIKFINNNSRWYISELTVLEENPETTDLARPIPTSRRCRPQRRRQSRPTNRRLNHEKPPAPAKPPRGLPRPHGGFTDRTFRLLCLERGADVVYTEMISAKGLLYQSARTRALYFSRPGDAPFGVQLFGSEPETVAKAAGLVESELGERLFCIDLNMGCPAPKITGNGDGSALMRRPCACGRIIETTVKAVGVPVTVKFRKGWDEAHNNAVPFARMCQESGASCLTIHGRTARAVLRRKGGPDVHGGGQAGRRNPGDCKRGRGRCRKRAGHAERDRLRRRDDRRGALGNPFVFEEIRCALDGEPYSPPTLDERRERPAARAHGDCRKGRACDDRAAQAPCVLRARHARRGKTAGRASTPAKRWKNWSKYGVDTTFFAQI